MGRTIEADYLVVGAGAMGMAFTDTLVGETDATVVVVQQQLLPTGRVTYLPMSEYLGDGRVRSLGGDEIEVSARRAVTTHVEIVVPSMRPPSYSVAP